MDSNSKYQNNSLNNNSSSSKENNSDDFGVLLISHGSSLPYASNTFDEILNKYIDSTGHNTEIGYMKVAEPSISQAISKLNEKKNISKIIAMPVFLAQGIHTNIDIPIILGLNPLETDPRCPNGNYPDDHYLSNLDSIDFDGDINLIDCIGPDSTIIDIIKKRIDSSLKSSKLEIESEKTGILLVSHGSRLNYNREFITDVFNQYRKNVNFAVGQGFMELMGPTIPQAINELNKNNDLERLIVVPVFIAPGVHTTHDIPKILGLIDENSSKTHSHTHHHPDNHSHSHNHSHEHVLEKIEFEGEILYADPIGSDSLLIDIIKERINNELTN